MRNLYKWVGLKASATPGEIEAVLPRAPQDIQEDVRVVLLSPARREIYDDNHAVLTRIAMLRSRLGLNNSPHWDGETANEFGVFVAASSTPSARANGGRAASGKFEDTFKVLLLVCLALPVYLWVKREEWTNNARPTDSRASTSPTPAWSPPPPSNGIPPLLSAPTVSAAPSSPSIALPPEERLPRSGVVSRVGRGELIAPLKIVTEGPEHHVVKLVDIAGQDVMLVFVSAGTTFKAYVPLGQYELRYGAGTKWYGKKLTFGPKGSYSRADTTFNFNKSGTTISGYTVKLYKVEGGNMATAPISADAF